MRVSELLGSRVFDVDGAPAGVVTDLRLAQIGPVKGALAELEVEALLVSPRTTGSLFGYDRRSEQGPWLVRAVIRRLHRGARLVSWDDVAAWDAERRRIELR
jgi:sporulation protein YlmC with PRC-barrel domain